MKVGGGGEQDIRRQGSVGDGLTTTMAGEVLFRLILFILLIGIALIDSDLYLCSVEIFEFERSG
ncbi:unnamed protein product [Linum tenue]|uniref:Uncharacterized protein n=1 Tax=Linum tenue TaxID=586396 RepID=A0AAV0NXH4_9ROSI|nr:unnamed protein product [Linum tenue]